MITGDHRSIRRDRRRLFLLVGEGRRRASQIGAQAGSPPVAHSVLVDVRGLRGDRDHRVSPAKVLDAPIYDLIAGKALPPTLRQGGERALALRR
jgi:hypothetical protein